MWAGRDGSGGGAAEVVTGCAYRGVVRTEHGGPGGGHAGVVAAGLVPVAEFLRHPGEVETECEHQRVAVGAATLAGRVRLLEDPPGGGRVVGLAVQAGQQAAGGEYVGVVLTVGRSGRRDRVGEQAAGGRQVTGGAQREGLVLSGGQGGGVGHVSNAARNCRFLATRPPVSGPGCRVWPPACGADLGKRCSAMAMCMIHPGRVQ
ncbi:hypothetical protein GCM10010169_58710 [Micromonospora fulviviridis]|nr:hypothetical protein GCM10010169_58710 [Micromonospora fulviviridis]